MGLLRKLGNKIRRDGLGYALQSLSRRIPPGLFYANGFVVFALEVPSVPPAENGGVREAGPADRQLLAINGCTPEYIEERFSSGARVWVEERDGSLVGHAWIKTEDLLWDRCIRLIGAPGDFWSFDGWIAPAQRGKGSYTRIKGTAAYEGGRAGHKRLLATVDALNRNSIRANRAIGSRPIGRGFTLRLLGLTLVRLDGTTHCGFWSEAKPLEIRLGPRGQGPERGATERTDTAVLKE